MSTKSFSSDFASSTPAELLPQFSEFCAAGGGRFDRVALISDIRGGSEGFPAMLEAISRLREKGIVCRLLFLSADTETIVQGGIVNDMTASDSSKVVN